MHFLRKTLLQAEIDRLRLHAERTVGRIERDLEVRNATDLNHLGSDEWLRQRLHDDLPQGERRLYAAVVNSSGEVLLHSDPPRRGQRLRRNWYNRILSELHASRSGAETSAESGATEVGWEVFVTPSPVLALGGPAYDIRIPIEIGDREVGEYHTGFDVGWFENSIADRQSLFVRNRSLLIGGVLLVVLLGATSLYYIATHSITLRRAVDAASLERATEVGKLAAGLAHEIRNPLHAIRLNLHTFRRAHERQVELPRDEVTALLGQSSREIDRIEQLMQQLVAFATPDEPRRETVNLTTEIEGVVEFLRREMLDKNVEIRTKLPATGVRARLDQGRLRQIMLNLLQNAQQALADGGKVEIELTRRRGRAEISVADNGPGIPEEDCERIFEPFYSTKPDGTGLGLALVKRFVEEVGGTIRCEQNSEGGVTFRIILRQAGSSRSA